MKEKNGSETFAPPKKTILPALSLSHFLPCLSYPRPKCFSFWAGVKNAFAFGRRSKGLSTYFSLYAPPFLSLFGSLPQKSESILSPVTFSFFSLSKRESRRERAEEREPKRESNERESQKSFLRERILERDMWKDMWRDRWRDMWRDRWRNIRRETRWVRLFFWGRKIERDFLYRENWRKRRVEKYIQRAERV